MSAKLSSSLEIVETVRVKVLLSLDMVETVLRKVLLSLATVETVLVKRFLRHSTNAAKNYASLFQKTRGQWTSTRNAERPQPLTPPHLHTHSLPLAFSPASYGPLLSTKISDDTFRTHQNEKNPEKKQSQQKHVQRAYSGDERAVRNAVRRPAGRKRWARVQPHMAGFWL